jgi:hypothetical protein
MITMLERRVMVSIVGCVLFIDCTAVMVIKLHKYPRGKHKLHTAFLLGTSKGWDHLADNDQEFSWFVYSSLNCNILKCENRKKVGNN